MADINFEYAFQPPNPAEYVAHKAVITRLLRRGPDRDVVPRDHKAWKEAFDRSLWLWRRRVSQLGNQGVGGFQNGQLAQARNCHPWGLAVQRYDNPAVYCHHIEICPWCSGRATSRFYFLLQRVCADSPDTAIVALTGANFFPVDLNREQLSKELSLTRRVLSGLARANKDRSLAAAWNIGFDPPSQARRIRQDAFCIRSRFLMLLPSSVDHILMPQGRGWQLFRYNRPTEEARQQLVAKVCAYSPGMLLSDNLELIHRFFAARTKIRLSELSGEFRGLSDELVDDL